MATNKETVTPWRTTVIVSACLQDHESTRLLASQQHRIRLSDGVVPGAFVLPLSGTAFLLVDLQNISGGFAESGLIDSIRTFVQVHGNSFLLLLSPFNGKKELEILSELQLRFLGSNLRVLPVRSSAEVVKGMLTVAKATSKPHVDNICQRMSLARAHVIDSSPAWELLRDTVKPVQPLYFMPPARDGLRT